MKIFLTGISGFIGGNLANKLLAAGHEVHALIRKEPPIKQRHPNLRYFNGDIVDAEAVKTAIKGCNQVYHVAGYAKLWAARRRTFYDINVTGTENVLQASLETGVAKMVYTSSCAVFGPSLKMPLKETDPRITAFNNDYDLSKFIAEGSVRSYNDKGLETVIVNPSRVYGPGEVTHANMITKMLIRCLHGSVVMMPGVKNVIGNYAYIDDVVQGHISAMENGRPGERYIVGGENLSYQQVIKIIGEELRAPRLLPLPAAAVRAWGFIELLKYRVTGNEPRFTPEAVGRYLQNAAFDCSKATNEIGYSITGFRDGIRKTIQYIKQNS